jgi:nucleotide-binding universal stress UspA family protein
VVTLGHPPVDDLVLLRVIPEADSQGADAYLEALAARVRTGGPRIETRVMVSQDPAAAIVRAAAGMDLIAMQTRGERGMTRLLHGSVVANVIHDTPVPVLVGRPRAK